jgi:hypothetical protein
MKRLLTRLLLVLALCGGLAVPAAIPAFADIMIMPIRIVFSSRDRMQDITVFNSSNVQAGTYQLAWIYAAQTEEGAYKRLDVPLNPELDPETAILFSPRQVTLQPGGKQRVRLSLRRPANLPDGEYRAHLYLKNTKKQSGGKMAANGIQIGVGMNVGLAVPVIIRQGAYDGAASIGPPQFIPGSADGKYPPKIKIDINRSGKFSTIGNVNVYWKSSQGGEEKLIARQNAINIFPEVSRRILKIPLKVDRVVGGTVRIVFEGDGPDKGITFDEKTFPVGG